MYPLGYAHPPTARYHDGGGDGMDEAYEVLEGCAAILETLEEERHDPRHYVLIAALGWVAGVIDDAMVQDGKI